MFFKKWKGRSRRIKKEVLPQILLILGFICAALIEEMINLLHENILSWGTQAYLFYSVAIFISFCLIVFLILHVIRNVYMEFRLSSSNPIGDIVPRGATGVTMMSFDISAPNDDHVTIKRLTISHSGGSRQDIAGIYLSIVGARVSPVEFLNANGKATMHFTWPVSVEPGEKITVDVNVDFSPGASAGSQHRLLIESDESLVTNAHTTIGSFPVEGEWFHVGAVTCGLITINYSDFSGKDIIGSVVLSADSVEDQTLYSITLKKRGNINDADIQNLYLTERDGKKLTNTVSQTVDGYVTLVFDPPFTILKGGSVNFEIHGRAKSSGEVEMYFEEKNDLFGVGSLYGYGLKGQLYGSSVRIEGKPSAANFR